MKINLQDERGYTLLTVILIFTLFMILGLAFMTLSISSMKQTTTIEKKSHSIEFAEMGATYYYQNIIDYLPKIESLVKSEVENSNISKQGVLETIMNIIDQMDFDEKVEIKNANSEKSWFTIEKKPSKVDGESIILSAISKGKKNDEEYEIVTEVTLDFSGALTIGGNAGNIIPTIALPLVIDEKCQEPVKKLNKVQCKVNVNEKYSFNDKLELSNDSYIHFTNNVDFNNVVASNKSSLYIQGIANFNDKLDFHNESYIYVTNGANFKGVDSNKSTIHIIGPGIFNDKLDLKNDSNIYIDNSTNNANFKGVGTNKSNLYISGSATFSEKLDLINDSLIYINKNSNFKGVSINKSTLYIGGNAKFTEPVDINQNGKLCVKGTFEFNNLNNNGKIYAPNYSGNNRQINTNENDFKNECNFSPSDSSNLIIDQNKIEIKKIFDYN